jgi:topoisomerase-4 subunit B
LHGVGASVTNALSEWLKVEVYDGKTTHFMQFTSYKDKKGKVHSGVPVAPLANTGKKTKKRGSFGCASMLAGICRATFSVPICG